MRWFLLVALLASGPAHAKKSAPPPPPAWKCGDAVASDYSDANSALNAGKLDEAQAGFTTVLTAEPSCGLALVGSGRALLGLGRAADAVTPLATASSLFADKLDAHLWLARARLAAGDDPGALAAAKLAIGLKAGSVDAQKVAQQVLLHQKAYADAHQMLATARAAANVTAWSCLEGLVYADEGDTAHAEEMLVACQGVPDASMYEALATRLGKPTTPPTP
jgi:predicted Zn-dependent protease